MKGKRRSFIATSLCLPKDSSLSNFSLETSQRISSKRYLRVNHLFQQYRPTFRVCDGRHSWRSRCRRDWKRRRNWVWWVRRNIERGFPHLLAWYSSEKEKEHEKENYSAQDLHPHSKAMVGLNMEQRTDFPQLHLGDNVTMTNKRSMRLLQLPQKWCVCRQARLLLLERAFVHGTSILFFERVRRHDALILGFFAHSNCRSCFILCWCAQNVSFYLIAISLCFYPCTSSSSGSVSGQDAVAKCVTPSNPSFSATIDLSQSGTTLTLIHTYSGPRTFFLLVVIP